MLAPHNAASCYRIPGALPALLLVLLILTLLVGCTDDAANQAAQTPLPSASAAPSAPPDPLGTSPYVSSQGPAPSDMPRVSAADALASVQARELAVNGPTATPTSTTDPSLPTSTPVPTNTPRPTSTPFPPAPPLTNPVPDRHQAGVQYFPQTGHTLRGVFLDYWNKHGGLAQFGYPITEEFVEADGQDNKPLQVQYFEHNRFEQHPENAGTPNEVQFGLLGTETATKKGYFGGSYPRYGHAADFSWIAGRMTLHVLYGCSSPQCGCSIVTYGSTDGGSDMKIQLEGKVWRDIEEGSFFAEKGTIFPAGTFLQASGHLAGPKERGSACGLAGVDEPIGPYIVDRVQTNSVP